MRTFNGECFIVPNGLMDVTEKTLENRCGAYTTAELALFNKHKDEQFVQVWMTGEGCDNWYDDFHDFRVEHLPLSFFDGKKEGDTVEFDSETSSWGGWKGKGKGGHLTPEKCHVVLTLNQSGCRYRRFGNFETVLNRLKEVHAERLAA